MQYIPQVINGSKDIANIHKQLLEIYNYLGAWSEIVGFDDAGNFYLRNINDIKNGTLLFNMDDDNILVMTNDNTEEFEQVVFTLDTSGNIVLLEDMDVSTTLYTDMFELDDDGNITTTDSGT